MKGKKKQFYKYKHEVHIFRVWKEKNVLTIGDSATKIPSELTGQILFKTTISPLGSMSPLDARHPITIDRAGSHDFA